MLKQLFLIIFLLLSVNLAFGQDSLQKNNGYVKFKHDNGVIASEGTMRDGLPDGYWKSYNKKGILISQGNRKDFLLDSTWNFYNDEGKLSMTVNYKNNKKNGLKISFLSDSKIEEEYKDNVKINFEKQFDLNGKLIKITPFQNGLEEGISKDFNTEGVIILLTYYQKGYVTKREFINRVDGSGKKQGLWKTFNKSDILIVEATYLNGKKHGFYKEYDENGNLVKIEKYENDQLIVNAVETRKLEMRIDYHSNGNPKVIGTYYNGVAEGVRREFNEKGQVIQSYIMQSGYITGKGVMDNNGLKQGAWEEYYDERYAKPNEKLIRAKGKYKNSKPVGEWSYFFVNGKVEIEGSFNESGKKEGTWTWYYPKGNILIQDNYVDGQKEGLYIEYDENKKVIVKGNYLEDKEEGQWSRANNDFIEEGKYTDGKREGAWKGYYKNGKPTYECNYADNNYDGKYICYWENGRIKEQGIYQLGLRNGTWRKFDQMGNLFLIVTYKNGIEIRYEGVKIEPTLEEGE